MNKSYGAAFMIASTAIGGGTLALPLVIGASNVIMAILLLSISAIIMLYAAIIIVEVNIILRKCDSVVSLSNDVLGRVVGVIGAFTLFTLLSTLITAYSTALGEMVASYLTPYSFFSNLNIPHFASFFFATLFSVLVATSYKLVDYGNRIFFVAKIVCFIAMCLLFTPAVRVDLLMEKVTMPALIDKNMLLILPIFITSFGFHASIPYIMKYVGRNDVVGYSRIFGRATILTAVIYLLWIVSIVSIIPLYGDGSFAQIMANRAANNDLPLLLVTLAQKVGHSFFTVISTVFTFTAIATSFLGVLASMYDLCIEITKVKSPSMLRKIGIFVFIFFPPAVQIIYGANFLYLLAFASIALVILAIIIPCAIMLRLLSNSKFSKAGLIFSNVWSISVMLFAGGAIIAVELWNIFAG